MPDGRFLRVFDGITVVGRSGWGGKKPFSGPKATDGNIYLVDGGDELALIDCGDGLGWPQIKRNIRAAGYSPDKIKKIILTHCHFDHALGANAIRKNLKISVMAHIDDAIPLEQGDEIRIGGRMPGFKLPCPIHPTPVNRRLKHGNLIKVGAWSLKVIHTPGHTPGSICLLANRNGKKILFTGDTVIGDQPNCPTGMFGWITPNYASNLGDYKITLKRIKALKADVLLPGHGISQTKNIPRVMDHCLKRLQRVLDIPGGPFSLMPIQLKATGRIH